jgi:hypothetical protein
MAKLSKFSLNFGLTEGSDEPLGGRQVTYGTEIHHIYVLCSYVTYGTEIHHNMSIYYVAK